MSKFHLTESIVKCLLYDKMRSELWKRKLAMKQANSAKWSDRSSTSNHIANTLRMNNSVE